MGRRKQPLLGRRLHRRVADGASHAGGRIIAGEMKRFRDPLGAGGEQDGERPRVKVPRRPDIALIVTDPASMAA